MVVRRHDVDHRRMPNYRRAWIPGASFLFSVNYSRMREHRLLARARLIPQAGLDPAELRIHPHHPIGAGASASDRAPGFRPAYPPRTRSVSPLRKLRSN